MEKSVDAFRTISEVADDLDLPQHVLRFWETRFAQIRPLKRAGGRRYYRPSDIVLLRNIRQLLYAEGYTIKGVQRLLKEKGARSLRGDLSNDGATSDFDALELSPGEPPQGRSGLPHEVPPDGHSADDRQEEVQERAHWASSGVAIDPPTDPPDHETSTAGLHVSGPSAVRAALAEIEECERILRAVRHPCS